MENTSRRGDLLESLRDAVGLHAPHPALVLVFVFGMAYRVESLGSEIVAVWECCGAA